MRANKAQLKNFLKALPDDEDHEWWCSDTEIAESVLDWLEGWLKAGQPDKLTRYELWEFEKIAEEARTTKEKSK